jgi:hypothetical protein
MRRSSNSAQSLAIAVCVSAGSRFQIRRVGDMAVLRCRRTTMLADQPDQGP